MPCISRPLAPLLLRAGGLFLCLLSGCAPSASVVKSSSAPEPGDSKQTLATGVTHRALAQVDGNGIDIIDIDLTKAGAHPVIAAQGIHRESGTIVAQALTPSQWLVRTGAIAAINGGYFGREVKSGQREIVGLLVQHGRVRHASPPFYGRGGAVVKRGYYVRSAFGLTATGRPAIVWAATDPANPQTLVFYLSPTSRHGRKWAAAAAIG